MRCCLTGNDVSSRLVVLCHQHKHNNIYKMIEQQQPPGKQKKTTPLYQNRSSFTILINSFNN